MLENKEGYYPGAGLSGPAESVSPEAGTQGARSIPRQPWKEAMWAAVGPGRSEGLKAILLRSLQSGSSQLRGAGYH